MAKGKSTIASLVRTASKDEGEFVTTVQEVVDEADHERVHADVVLAHLERECLREREKADLRRGVVRFLRADALR